MMLTTRDEASSIILDTLSLPLFFWKYSSLIIIFISYLFIVIQLWSHIVKSATHDTLGKFLPFCPAWLCQVCQYLCVCGWGVWVGWDVSSCFWLQMLVIIWGRPVNQSDNLMLRLHYWSKVTFIVIMRHRSDVKIWNGNQSLQLVRYLSRPINCRPMFEQSTIPLSARQLASLRRKPVSDVYLGSVK